MSDKQLREEDCRVDVWTIGRQNPVVVVTHIPTGQRAECSANASVILNRKAAMKALQKVLDTRSIPTDGR